jgi:hypothetical protein
VQPASRAAHWIDPNASQQRHVDHEAALADRKPCDVVAAAAHGNEKPVLTREPNGLHDIDRTGATSHKTGATIDHRVPDLARLLVFRVIRSQHLAFECSLERLQDLRRKVHCPAVHACELDRHESSPGRVVKFGVLLLVAGRHPGQCSSEGTGRPVLQSIRARGAYPST